MSRALPLFLLAASLSWGDVVVLKDGRQVSGRVVDKGLHYEVLVEGVLRTFLKEEVDRLVASPKDLLGDADVKFEEAKAGYQRALQAPAAEQNAVLKDSIVRLAAAREAYAAAVDLFPDDAALPKKLMLIMQLTRMLRDRVGSEMARPGAAPPPPPVGPVAPPPPPAAVDEAFRTLVDPLRRGDPAKRESARAAFAARRASEFSVAAAEFLSRSDAEMKLQGAALQAAQGYLASPSLRDAERLDAGAALKALQELAALKGKPDTAPAADALLPFAFLHAGAAGTGPDAEKAFRALGMSVVDGLPGTPEGHAVRDLNAWIASGEFDLAVLAFVKEHRAADTPAVRFVWSYALLRLVHAKKRGWERPAAAWASVKAAGPLQEHLSALIKSLKAAASCNVCAGEGRLRCTNCHGQKEIKFVCARCKGKGKSTNKFGVDLLCVPCKSTGVERLLKCEKCKDGWTDCRQCEAPKAPPALEDIAGEDGCPDCRGRGLAYARAAVVCRRCLGLGRLLVPKADPARRLGD